MIKHILKVLQEAGGQLECSEIKERIADMDDQIAEYSMIEKKSAKATRKIKLLISAIMKKKHKLKKKLKTISRKQCLLLLSKYHLRSSKLFQEHYYIEWVLNSPKKVFRSAMMEESTVTATTLMLLISEPQE